MIEIEKRGDYVNVDSDGYIINPASLTKIQPEWKPVIEDIVEQYKSTCGNALQAVFIRGSVAKGTAVMHLSDVDTFAYANLTRNEIPVDWMDEFEKKMVSTYPFVQNIELSIDPISEAYDDRIMLVQSVCVYGTDISQDMPKVRIGKDLITTASRLEERYAWLRAKLPTLDDPEELKKGCTWLMKLFLRSGAEIVMDRSHLYARDLYPCYEIFSRYYPEKESEMRNILNLALNPIADKEFLENMMSDFGEWLRAEAAKHI